jgi:hypothetical protein
MQTRIRRIGPESAQAQVTRLQALERFVPLALVKEVLQDCHAQKQRCRKMAMHQVVYLVLAMNLFARQRLSLVLERLLHTWRCFFAEEEIASPSDSAIHQRRDQLGVAPLMMLFHRVCQPLATSATRGAFLFGLRLMAIDSKTINLFDNPFLARHFGRPKSGRGAGAFPQARLVTLTEIGTHATLDAGIYPLAIDERRGVRRLLRSMAAGMLIYMDRGFYSAEMMLLLAAQGAHVVARLPANVKPKRVKRLCDGSWLVEVRRWGIEAHHPEASVLLRLLRYRFRGAGPRAKRRECRLVTTLLDPIAFPAVELAVSYHERWDIEETYDEMEVHLLGGSAPLRSRSVVGVLQEIYGLLIAHYAIRALMHEAAVRAEIDPDHLSFTAAVTLVQEAIRDFQLVAPAFHEALFAWLFREIAKHRVPQRLPRSNPRVVRRKMSNFPLKRPKDRPYQMRVPYREAICLS